MKTKLGLICLVTLVFALPAWSGVGIQGTVDGDTHHMHLQVSFEDWTDYEYGFLILRDYIGICIGPGLVTPEPIVIVPEALYVPQHYTFDLPASSYDIYARYTVKAVTADGGMVDVSAIQPTTNSPVFHMGPTGAVIARGRIEIHTDDDQMTHTYLVPCATNCWLNTYRNTDPDNCYLGTYPLGESPYVEFDGQIVDVVGTPNYNSMPPAPPDFVIDSVTLAIDDDCGPVPSTHTSWSALKAQYR